MIVVFFLKLICLSEKDSVALREDVVEFWFFHNGSCFWNGLGFYPMFCSLRLMFSNFIKRCFSLINHLNRLFILFILKMMILSFIIITLIPSWRKYGRINIMLMILVHFFLPRLISRNRMIMNRWLQLPLILITLTNPITIAILFLRETITRLLSNHLILVLLVIMNLVVY